MVNPAAEPGIARKYLEETFSNPPRISDDLKNSLYVCSTYISQLPTEVEQRRNDSQNVIFPHLMDTHSGVHHH